MTDTNTYITTNVAPATYTTLARAEDESYADYRIRRKLANDAVKALKYGETFHMSSVYGTYENKEKQALKAARKARKSAKKG
jgi:argonaute-like protein implicated in RNA metabolism and viral defense